MNLIKKLVIVLFVSILGISLIPSNRVYAESKDINSKEKLEVKVIYNSFDEKYIEEITLDDGTKVGDYDYSIKYFKLPKLYTSLISEYFNYVGWIKREDIVSLSLDPTSKVRKNYTAKNSAWKLISSPTDGLASDPEWKNTQSLKWQYDCHYSFAKSKERWNIEPHRTPSSYIEVVAKGCNP